VQDFSSPEVFVRLTSR